VPDQPNPTLGVRLKQLREERGLTQEDLALNADITVSTLSRIERDAASPRWNTVNKIAEALDINLLDI
jgi:transcriptional regulator with XRE-family HTH domain